MHEDGEETSNMGINKQRLKVLHLSELFRHQGKDVYHLSSSDVEEMLGC